MTPKKTPEPPAALVTGATGFVGSHLVDELLVRRWKVRVTVRKTSPTEWLDGRPVERVEADLRRDEVPPEAFAGVTHVFHVAGTLSGTAEQLREGNAVATGRMIGAALKHGAGLRRFVHVSSLAAAGPSEPGRPIDEEAPCRPISAYGRTKREGERAAWAARDRMPVTVIRPPVVYGPRDRGVLPVFQMAARGIAPTFGRPVELSLVHVGDLVRGIADAAVAEAAAGRVYFLCHPAVPKYAEVLAAAGAACGAPVRRVRIPPAVLWTAAHLGEAASRRGWIPPLLNRDKARELLQPAWACSPARAEREFGFRARTAFPEGFAETARWYRARGWLT